MEIPDRPAIGHHMTAKSPASAKHLAEQELAAAAGFAIHGVVGAHERLDAFLAQSLKRRQIRLPQVARSRVHIELMAQRLRPAVHREMFGTGRCLQVTRVVTLQAPHERGPQFGCQSRILPPCLLAAPPTWVAKNVDVRGPESEPLVLLPAALTDRLVVLGAGFIGNRRGHLPDQIHIPCGRHADGLRKNRSPSVPRHSVKCLVPPIVSRDTETLNGCRVITKLGAFLEQRKPSNQIPDPLFPIPRDILKTNQTHTGTSPFFCSNFARTSLAFRSLSG